MTLLPTMPVRCNHRQFSCYSEQGSFLVGVQMVLRLFALLWGVHGSVASKEKSETRGATNHSSFEVEARLLVGLEALELHETQLWLLCRHENVIRFSFSGWCLSDLICSFVANLWPISSGQIDIAVAVVKESVPLRFAQIWIVALTPIEAFIIW